MLHLLNNPKYLGIAFVIIVIIIAVAMTFYVKNCVKTEIDEIRTVTKKKKIVLMKRHQEMMAKRAEEERRRHMQMMEEKRKQEEAIAHTQNKEEQPEEDLESYIDPVQMHEDNVQSYNEGSGDNGFSELNKNNVLMRDLVNH
jgi:RNase adaptor protein for sRNA GlmZ degradation